MTVATQKAQEASGQTSEKQENGTRGMQETTTHTKEGKGRGGEKELPTARNLTARCAEKQKQKGKGVRPHAVEE